MTRLYLPSSNAISALNDPKGLKLKWKPLQDKTLLSEVDLIVPFHGQYERVGKLIDSLWKYTQGIVYNLCLVDDGSPNRDFMDSIAAKKFPSVYCLRHEKRKGFGAAINTGLSNTKSPWVVILNSDVEFVESPWLKNLGECYFRLKEFGVKMVSARMDNIPEGNAKVKYDPANYSDHILDPKTIEDVLEDMPLPFVCVLANRELFQRVGPIKEYPLGWYEDLEYACRMLAKGYKQGVCGTSRVKHACGATVEAICESESLARKVFESNFDLCTKDIKLIQKNMESSK